MEGNERRFIVNIVCIGSGAFGVAITSLLAKNEENKIFLWTHDEIFVKTVYKDEKLYITNKSIPLPDNVVVGTNLEEMIPESNVIFLLVSTSFIKDIAQKLQQFDLKNKRIFLGSKGVLEHTPFFYSKYLRQKLDVRDVDFFAGPNLAQD